MGMGGMNQMGGMNPMGSMNQMGGMGMQNMNMMETQMMPYDGMMAENQMMRSRQFSPGPMSRNPYDMMGPRFYPSSSSDLRRDYRLPELSPKLFNRWDPMGDESEDEDDWWVTPLQHPAHGLEKHPFYRQERTPPQMSMYPPYRDMGIGGSLRNQMGQMGQNAQCNTTTTN